MTILLHTDRYSLTATTRKGGVVVHDSESGDGSSANLISALKSPGDRPSVGHAGRYGAGYHAVTDGLGGYVRLADGSAAPYAAPPVNGTWWHVCMPGFANQTRDQWLNDISRQHIRGVARFIHDAWIEDGKTWQPSFVFADLLGKGVHGYTSHYQVSLAWRKSTHTDPGMNFPFDILEADVWALVNNTQQEEDMPARQIQVAGDPAVFMVSGIECTWIQDEAVQAALVASRFINPNVEQVDRLVLKGLELHGPCPQTQTTPADFARHVP